MQAMLTGLWGEQERGALPARLDPTETLHKPLHQRSLSSDNHSNDSWTGFLKEQRENCNLLMNEYTSVVCTKRF